MKILVLVADAFGAPGGIARYNRDFLAALAMQPAVEGIKVLPPNATFEERVPESVEQLPPMPGKWLYAAKALRLAVKQRSDLIFCGHLNLLPRAWVAAKLSDVPLWLQLHHCLPSAAPRGASESLLPDRRRR